MQRLCMFRRTHLSRDCLARREPKVCWASSALPLRRRAMQRLKRLGLPTPKSSPARRAATCFMTSLNEGSANARGSGQTPELANGKEKAMEISIAFRCFSKQRVSVQQSSAHVAFACHDARHHARAHSNALKAPAELRPQLAEGSSAGALGLQHALWQQKLPGDGERLLRQQAHEGAKERSQRSGNLSPRSVPYSA